jgi:hypothetical protein
MGVVTMAARMDARAVKSRLYSRHPGSSEQMPGPWTVIEEFRCIDLLAFSAWSSAQQFARVGYEVKISRSDLRRELLKPHKRTCNVEWCNEFYFAVPAGLLTPEEIAYEQPEWEPEDFNRTPCRYSHRGADSPAWNDDLGPCNKGKRETLLIGPLRKWDHHYRPRVHVQCDGCGGKGYAERSRVEQEAPTLWIPPDVGLVIVDGRGTRVVKKAPRRREVPMLSAGELGQLVRFVSMRPDARHHPINVPARQEAAA